MSTKTEFASKIGLIAATVGSAVGLGNIWRFPAEAQAGGGSAFLLLYVLCVLLLGVPVMLAEFFLGRGTKSDSIGAFRKLTPGSKWWTVGSAAVLASYLILCFYTVVEGWTLEYLYESITGGLFDGLGSSDTEESRLFFGARMEEYVQSDLRPLIFVAVAIAVNMGVLLGGVQKGIERLSNILMPVLFIILAVLMGVSLTLPGASEGVAYFLKPDFSKITPEVVFNALGQAFFSLSLGMGILITYSSYYPKDTRLARTSVIVALLSLLVAVMVGLVIFPAVKSFGLDNQPLQGATLVFVTLPEIFARLPLPQLWSALFFILLAVAAITSCISIAEVSVATLQDRCKMSRVKAVMCVMLPLTVLSALPSLSFGSLEWLKIFGMTIFDFLDNFSTNILLPLVSLGVCLYVGWALPSGFLRDELTNKGSYHSPLNTLSAVIIRYLAPVLIILVFVYDLL